MIVEETIEGYENFKAFVAELEPGAKVIFYFSGSKLPTGESWCSDCVKAEPVYNQVLAESDSVYRVVHVLVGDREYWKDLNCPFRKDPDLRLLVIPVYLKWKTVQRLDGEHCQNKDLVELIFNEEEED